MSVEFLDSDILGFSKMEQFPWKGISILPVEWLVLCLGLFSSIRTPFGSFFASGFKRAFKVKDFGDSIPGHGGLSGKVFFFKMALLSTLLSVSYAYNVTAYADFGRPQVEICCTISGLVQFLMHLLMLFKVLSAEMRAIVITKVDGVNQGRASTIEP